MPLGFYGTDSLPFGWHARCCFDQPQWMTILLRPPLEGCDFRKRSTDHMKDKEFGGITNSLFTITPVPGPFYRVRAHVFFIPKIPSIYCVKDISGISNVIDTGVRRTFIPLNRSTYICFSLHGCCDPQLA